MRLAQLDIPAKPEFVSLARLVVSSIADDRYALTDDQLDDLKLAVSEACVVAIESQEGSAGGNVAISCIGHKDGLEVWVDGPTDFGVSSDATTNGAVIDPDSPTAGRDLGMPLIGTLVDEVDVSKVESGSRLRMVVRARLNDDH